MTPQQKDLILRFMRIILSDMHPHFDEYPISRMEQCVDEGLAVDGSGFEETPYDQANYLIQAFWMNRIIKELEQA